MKKYWPPVVMLVIFEIVAVTLWLTKDNMFYLFNFSYIGIELTNKSPIEYCPPTGSMPGNICRPGRYNKKQVASMKAEIV